MNSQFRHTPVRSRVAAVAAFLVDGLRLSVSDRHYETIMAHTLSTAIVGGLVATKFAGFPGGWIGMGASGAAGWMLAVHDMRNRIARGLDG